MPNLTAFYPVKTGNLKKDYDNLYQWAIAILDELKSLLNNLDSGNVLEASSVKAEHIDTNTAKISQGQIGELSAEKITSGTIDAEKIKVTNISADNIKSGALTITSDLLIRNSDASMVMDGNGLVLYDEEDNERLYMGRDNKGKFILRMLNAAGTEGLSFDDRGILRVKNCIYFNTGDSTYLGPGLRFIDPDSQVLIRQLCVNTDGTIDIWGGIDAGSLNDVLRINGHALAFQELIEQDFVSKDAFNQAYNQLSARISALGG